MTDLVTRPVDDLDEDAKLISDALNAIDVGDGAEPGWSAGEIRMLLDGWLRDPVEDSRLVVAPSGELAAVALVAAPPAGGSRADMIGGVLHAYRERGVGRELFGWQVARIRELHAERPGEHWHIETGALTRDEKSQRFFTRFGFAPVRYQFDMAADTAAAVQVAPPDGIRVVPYTPELAERVHAAHQEAFADHWDHQHRSFEDWIKLTVGADIFRAGTSRVALDGDEVAAYVLTYDADDDLYLGQVGTRRPWRGRGLASTLLGAVLAAAAGAYPRATLVVDAQSQTGAVGVYERAGFRVREEFRIYHGDIA